MGAYSVVVEGYYYGVGCSFVVLLGAQVLRVIRMSDERILVKKTWKERLLPKKPWWKNLLFDDWRDGVIFLMAVLLMLSHYYDTQPYRDVAANPCAYCPLVSARQYMDTEVIPWTISEHGTITPHNDSKTVG